MELTRSELEIMEVLWDSGKPMSRSDLLARPEDKTWKDGSVHILLNSLLQKGAIEEAGVVKRSKTYGRIFVPTMSREQYYAQLVFCHRGQPELVGLIDALLDREDLPREQLERIARLVERKLT